MSLSDCEKCWSTPCTCGWEYRNYTANQKLKLIAAILGLSEIPTIDQQLRKIADKLEMPWIVLTPEEIEAMKQQRKKVENQINGEAQNGPTS